MSMLVDPYTLFSSGGGSGITARAFRVYIIQRSQSGSGTTSSGYMNIKGGFAATVGGPNLCSNGSGGLATGATGAVSTQINGSLGATGGWGSDRGNAGGNFWHSLNQASPWWISIDFGVGNTVTVEELFLMPVNTLADQRTPYELYVQTSPDNVTWTNAYYFSTITGWVLNTLKSLPLI